MDDFLPKASRSWVDAKNGWVSRNAFTADEVFDLELDRVFDRTWTFVAHESEIPNPGDYVSRMLGGVPVIVVRDDSGIIRGHLNSCRHRGSKVCRSDAGNTRYFTCPYHGWTYQRNGALVTTTFDKYLAKESLTELGLVPITQIASYKGLIFGCWSADTEPLDDYLGDFRFYLDAFFARTPQGMQVLAPPHRWRTKANWKIGALNFIGDSQHTPTTHAGPLTLDPVRAARSGLARVSDDSFQIVTDRGHGCTLTYLRAGLPAEAYNTRAAEIVALYAGVLDPDRVGVLERLRVAVGTVFPNFSFIESQAAPARKAVIMRLWQPVSATEMEILSWVLAESEASGEYKSSVLKAGFHNFGAAGVFEQDDLELWISATNASNNRIARKYPYSFQTALPFMDKPVADHKWPGCAYRPADTEVAQFLFMRRWDELMTAGDQAMAIDGALK